MHGSISSKPETGGSEIMTKFSIVSGLWWIMSVLLVLVKPLGYYGCMILAIHILMRQFYLFSSDRIILPVSLTEVLEFIYNLMIILGEYSTSSWLHFRA